MADDYSQYLAVLTESMLFRNFSTEEIEECIRDACPVVKKVNKKEIITLPEQLDHIYVILSGQFNVLQDSSLVHILKPGECFGTAFCVLNIPCSHALQAAGKGSLLILSYNSMLEQKGVSQRLLENLLAVASEHLLILAEKINHTQSKSVRVKLSVFLRDEAKYSGSSAFRMKMSRKDLADYLNVTYPAMLRELSRMQKEEIIRIDGDKIQIRNLDKLIEQGLE